MERIDENGDNRKLDPFEVAAIDQLEARHRDLARQLLAFHERTFQAAQAGDLQEASRLTGELGSLCRNTWPGIKDDALSFIMYLVGIIEHAKQHTERTYDVADTLLAGLATLLPPDHPLLQVPGLFDEEAMTQRLTARMAKYGLMDEDYERSTFETDTGVRLEGVHEQGQCEGEFCVIHRPCPGPWDTWETHWVDDWKMMVRVCPHGIGHPAIEEQLMRPVLGMTQHAHPDQCTCPCDLSRVDPVLDAQSGAVTGYRAK